MKKSLNLTTVILCLAGFILFTNDTLWSQGNNGGNANGNNNANGNALKWETQGNNADSSHFIGTTNPTALKMKTNNIERVRITEDGKIGIGISNPLEKFELQGNFRLQGDIIFSDYQDLSDTTEDRLLVIDEFGRTKSQKMNQLRSSMYAVDCYQVCCDDPVEKSHVVGLTLPSWGNAITNDKQILYTGVGCPTWVGIGTDLPDARLDVIGDARFSSGVRIGDQSAVETALHIENKYITGGVNKFENLIVVKDHQNRKILQLNNDGLLRAREIKVDLEVWPDYVFKADYELMPLNKVKEYIALYGHLPNVPSAEEIEADGVNLGQTARITMEKVEELTLYTIQLQEALEKQQKLIEEQQKMLEAQQEEIKALKKQ